jgi:hypothetical protein
MDNEYDIFEIPKITARSLEGKFIMFAHNTSFDYWIITDFTYSIDVERSKKESSLYDSVVYKPYGSYDISTDGTKTVISRKTTAENTVYGYIKATWLFDKVGSRKLAYHTSNAKLISRLKGFRQRIFNIKGGDSVKIYRKTKKKTGSPHHKINRNNKKDKRRI